MILLQLWLGVFLAVLQCVFQINLCKYIYCVVDFFCTREISAPNIVVGSTLCEFISVFVEESSKLINAPNIHAEY